MNDDVRQTVLFIPNDNHDLSFDEDMEARNKAAQDVGKILDEQGKQATGVVVLHADLDNREILGVIERYKDITVKFELADFDSTAAERRQFRRLWKSAGGPDIEDGTMQTASKVITIPDKEII